MKSFLLFLTHTVLLYSILLVLMSFQGALWLQLFSQFPSPCLWLTFIVYGSIYRSLPEAILLTYITTAVAAPFVSIPIGLFLACNGICMLLLLTLKSRFMITNPIYLAVLTLIVTLIFPVIHWLLSQIIEPNPIQNFEFISWIISSLLTALFSIPLYQLYIWVDDVSLKSRPTEVGLFK